SNFNFGANRLSGRISRNPVHTRCCQPICAKLGERSHDQGVATGIQTQHVKWLSAWADGLYTESLPLTDGVICQPVVLTDHLARAGENRPWLRDLRFMLAQKAAIISIRYEAQILAVMLGGRWESELCRQFAHLRLGIFAHGEHRLRKLLLS